MAAILVTGGAGYIGSHTVKALARAGFDVVVYDNLSAGHRQAVQGAELVEGDVTDGALLRRTFRRFDVSAVMHFAARLAVGESVRDPLAYYRSNVSGALALVEAMVSESVGWLVFSSTCAVYGEPIEAPITEEHPTRPINAYGQTKLTVEHALPHFERAYGLHAISLRYFNAAGADPEGQIGEAHDPELHLIPLALKAAAGGPPLALFGDDYPTPDGTCLRDYVHVSDLADAHVLALEALRDTSRSATYNLGNGRAYSVRDVLDSVARAAGCVVPSTLAPRREGDPAVLYASSDKARAELHWRPRFDDLDAIVETAWKWHTSHPHGYADESAG